jgi:hypothetical protein
VITLEDHHIVIWLERGVLFLLVLYLGVHTMPRAWGKLNTDFPNYYMSARLALSRRHPRRHADGCVRVYRAAAGFHTAGAIVLPDGRHRILPFIRACSFGSSSGCLKLT